MIIGERPDLVGERADLMNHRIFLGKGGACRVARDGKVSSSFSLHEGVKQTLLVEGLKLNAKG